MENKKWGIKYKTMFQKDWFNWNTFAKTERSAIERFRRFATKHKIKFTDIEVTLY